MRRTTFGFLAAAASTLALAASKATSPNIAAALKASAAGSSLRQEIHGCHYTCECGPLKDFGNKCTTGTCTCSACRSAVAGIPNVSARRRKACAVTSPLRSNGRVPLSELVRDFDCQPSPLRLSIRYDL